MGANIKQLKNRIRSVTSTMHITKAMELVAASKLKKAGHRLDSFRPYAEAVSTIMSRLSSCDCIYTAESKEKKILFICIAGDRGLAGGFNTDVFKALGSHICGKDYMVYPIGKRMNDYCRSHNVNYENGIISAEKTDLSACSSLGMKITDEFTSGKYDAVYAVYTRFLSMISHEVCTEKILPVEKSKAETKGDILFEPDQESVLLKAVPEYVSGKIYGCVTESLASELSARRNAMNSASDNAADMISDLNLKFNHARQGAITQEITEIIGGSEASK